SSIISSNHPDLLRKYSKNLIIKQVNMNNEIEKLNKKLHLQLSIKFVIKSKKMSAYSDVFRFVILFNYGGIYLDTDFILLRDFQPFYPYQFAYKWTFLNKYNTAILKLNKHSIINKQIHQDVDKQIIDDTNNEYSFRKLIRQLTQLGEIDSYYHPRALSSTQNTDLLRLPTVFFDPLWLVVDGVDKKAQVEWQVDQYGFDEVFYGNSFLSQNMFIFNGAFAYHWHNRFDMKPENGSFLQKWIDLLNVKIG
ncbi:unnamed protein product, partial [Didymodactylos carnosus]